MAIAKLGTDTNTTGNTLPGVDSSLSHTLVAGTLGFRKVLVFIVAENGDSIGVSGVTYGGQVMSLATEYEQPTTGFRQFCAIWYLGESDLPADGANTVAVTFTGTASTPEYSIYCASYEGIAPGLPSDTDAAYQTTPATIANTVSAIPSTSWAFSIANEGNTGSWAHGQGQVEIYDYADASSQHAIAELRGGSGETSLDSTFTGTLNRLVRVCAVWDELTGPLITDVDTDNDIDDEQTNVVVTGTNFGASDTGSANVEIGDNSDYATANKISQPRSSWGATSITISAVDLGTQSPGQKWMWVTSSGADRSPAFQITVHRAQGWVMSASASITAGGENTTARLAPPATKTTGDFDAGRIADDENPDQAVNITTDNYTEMAWSIEAKAGARDVSYSFRVTVDGTPLDTYTVTPQTTVTAAVEGSDVFFFGTNF